MLIFSNCIILWKPQFQILFSVNFTRENMITICISTRNRPELLYRALCSIEACAKEKNTFNYKIVVGDASDIKEAVNANKVSVKKIALSIDLE